MFETRSKLKCVACSKNIFYSQNNINKTDSKNKIQNAP